MAGKAPSWAAEYNPSSSEEEEQPKKIDTTVSAPNNEENADEEDNDSGLDKKQRASGSGDGTRKRKAAPKTTKVAATKPPPKKTKTKRGAGYTNDEIMSFLDVMEEVVPIGPFQWDTVVNKHRESYPKKDRDVGSLRTKFNRLVSAQPPTGDPECPEEVRRAKVIYKLIEQKSDAAEEVEEEDLGFESEKDASESGEPKSQSSEPSNAVLQSANKIGVTPSSKNAPFRLNRTPQQQPSNQMDKLMEMMVFNMMSEQSQQARRMDEREPATRHDDDDDDERCLENSRVGYA